MRALKSACLSLRSEQVEAAAAIGAHSIELHTGSFGDHYHRKKERAEEIERLAQAAEAAHQLGVKVNAGHGLNYQNVSGLFSVPHLLELNIGHSIISRALTVGLAVAVKELLFAMQGYPGIPTTAINSMRVNAVKFLCLRIFVFYHWPGR